MISVEMIGYFSDEPGSQSFPAPGMSLLYSSRGDGVVVVGNSSSWWFTRRVKKRMAGAADLPVRSINAPAFVPGVDFSDHLNFWNQGWKAVMITDTGLWLIVSTRRRIFSIPSLLATITAPLLSSQQPKRTVAELLWVRSP